MFYDLPLCLSTTQSTDRCFIVQMIRLVPSTLLALTELQVLVASYDPHE